jgi:thiamine biosynthesis lipoprotein
VEAITAARAKCDYRKVHVDLSSQTLRIDASGIELDLGGIAKGYAADEAIRELSKLGISSALVAASGDLSFSGAPPGQRGWKIGIDSFDSADKPFTRVFMLANAAVSTSGGTEQYLEFQGKRYSHIIDPKTGMGLESELAVTTISRDGMRADAAATAVSVLGNEKGMAFIERHPDLAVLIVENDRSFESPRLRLLKEVYASR